MKNNIKSALESYKILVSSDIDVISILDAIAKQYRLLLQIKILRGKNEMELSKILGVNPYVITKIMPFVSSYNIDQIANKLYELSNIDIDIKINGYDKKDLLESFIIGL